MKRFRFPLNPVKAVRLQAKANAREAFATALREQALVEEELAATRMRVSGLEHGLRSGRVAGCSAAEAAHTFSAYQREVAVERECEQRVGTARAATEKARTAYVEAHRRVEMIARLEDKARLTHRLGVQREEQAEFDDLAGRRHVGSPSRFTL